uniref:Uncharacterized protein n=1 Tax=Arundo donax TaxID=35708 RepID=A0A0A9CEH3_ARUDO
MVMFKGKTDVLFGVISYNLVGVGCADWKFVRLDQYEYCKISGFSILEFFSIALSEV